jgi:RimJ/RimL family protein N-acetyltransferase
VAQVRAFGPDEWARLREIRLRALAADPGVFSSTYERESAYGEEIWRERLAGGGVFAVVDGAEVVGMTGIYVTREDPAAAGLWGSWLDPRWRGRGLSAAMYEARLAWARARPELERVLVSHRASNEASARANRRHGFVFTHRAPRSWPDGAEEDEVCYELRLR